MTEIPEHLLKRSKERRAALGLPGGEAEGEGATPAEPSGKAEQAAPVPAAAAASAPAKEERPPPPPKPDPPYVQAAKRRKRIPYWALPVVVLLPVWAFLYLDSVTEPEVQDTALTTGEEVYAACAGCHGASGEGGSGAKLSDGEVLKTFPDPEAMMQWIHLGADEWVGGSSGPYGDPDREGGARDAGELDASMPAFADLDAEELAAVTRYIREQLSGEPVASEEVQELYEQWAEEAIETAQNGEIIYKDGVEPDQERIDLVSGG